MANDGYDFEHRKPRDAAEWLYRLCTCKRDTIHVRTRNSAEHYRRQLVERLGLAASSAPCVPTSPVDSSLLDFCVSCHMNIDWYSRRTMRELRYRRVYFGLSILLLGVLPVGLSFLSGDGKTPAQITGILTGLLAVHRGFSAWLEKRKAVARYWKALSALKTVLYEFESAWSGFPLNSEDDAKLLETAIESETAKCRRIVDEETIEHFEALSVPTFDLGAMLTGAGSTASQIVSRHAGARFAQTEKREKMTKELSVLDSTIGNLRQELRRIEDELVTALAKEDGPEITVLENARSDVLNKLNATQVERATIEARSRA